MVLQAERILRTLCKKYDSASKCVQHSDPTCNIGHQRLFEAHVSFLLLTSKMCSKVLWRLSLWCEKLVKAAAAYCNSCKLHFSSKAASSTQKDLLRQTKTPSFCDTDLHSVPFRMKWDPRMLHQQPNYSDTHKDSGEPHKRCISTWFKTQLFKAWLLTTVWRVHVSTRTSVFPSLFVCLSSYVLSALGPTRCLN